jgi:hypothetical protein
VNTGHTIKHECHRQAAVKHVIGTDRARTSRLYAAAIMGVVDINIAINTRIRPSNMTVHVKTVYVIAATLRAFMMIPLRITEMPSRPMTPNTPILHTHQRQTDDHTHLQGVTRDGTAYRTNFMWSRR